MKEGSNEGGFDDGEGVPPADPTKLRAMLQQFAHSGSNTTRVGLDLRGSASPSKVKSELSDSVDVNLKPLSYPGSRKRKSTGGEESIGDGSPKRQKPATKRVYAPPEIYEHLKYLTDFLKPGLEVVICGINPGIMSSTKGHHFANPTNHFWKCLHQSGLTDCFVPPAEDHTLPDRFSIGMTNLVNRPSAEAAELSPAEMREGVVPLLEKLSVYRPKFVCIVGKTIWNAISYVIEKDLDVRRPESQAAIATDTPGKDTKPTKKQKKKKSAKQEFDFGLQPYRLIHPDHNDSPSHHIELDSRNGLSIDASCDVESTLFWVVPSTSGKVVSYQLPDKIKLFRGLKESLSELNTGTLEISKMKEVRLPASEHGEKIP